MTTDAINDNASQALLPAGMKDTLPHHAGFEAHVVEQVMARFAAYGYDRVKPPLLEFEENLLRGPGEAVTSQTFRLMDPISQRMMGIRADMTPQVARIATSRLANAPRPLRLSYAGEILRVKGTQLREDRQFGQVGAEIIGADTPVADAEVILMAADTMISLGVGDLSVDLCLPTLIPALCSDLDIGQRAERDIRAALDRKDAALVIDLESAIGSEQASLIGQLLITTGPATEAIGKISTLGLGPKSRDELSTLSEVVSVLQKNAPDLSLTVDVVENRGWEYHTGVTFTFFTSGVRGELGAGGRYVTPAPANPEGPCSGEPATGLTLFTDTLLRAIPPARALNKIFVPLDVPLEIRESLRTEGWIVVAGIDDTTDASAEALRLKCTHVLIDNKPVSLD